MVHPDFSNGFSSEENILETTRTRGRKSKLPKAKLKRSEKTRTQKAREPARPIIIFDRPE
jgi:hypothetical protein